MNQLLQMFAAGNEPPPPPQPQQPQQHQQCGARHLCVHPDISLASATNHRCLGCIKQIHAPCGDEVEVHDGIITVLLKDWSFPVDKLENADLSLPLPHQLCLFCVKKIEAKLQQEEQERQLQQQQNSTRSGVSESNPIAASATSPAVLALYPDMPPDTPRDVLDGMLEQAMDGTAGPVLQHKWEQFFGAGRQHEPSTRLAELRANFTADGVKKKSKASSTFYKHQQNNTRFILYLYENERDILDDEFVQKLDDVNTDPDYSDLAFDKLLYLQIQIYLH